jgi:hypothetical protein
MLSGKEGGVVVGGGEEQYSWRVGYPVKGGKTHDDTETGRRKVGDTYYEQTTM